MSRRSPRLTPPRTVLLLATSLLAGSVVVASAQERTTIEPPTLRTCEATLKPSRQRCYGEALEHLVARDPAAAFASVSRHAADSGWFRRRCHMLMHPLGRRHGDRVPVAAVRHDGKDCVAGFLHGSLEHRLRAAGPMQRHQVRALCGAVGDTPLRRADCQHGVGHALMRNLDNELPLALSRCRGLGNSSFLRNCASGVFMENRFAATARDESDPTRYHRAGDPGYACEVGVPQDLLDTCHAWAVRDVDGPEQLRYCSRLAGMPTGACFVAVGAVGPTSIRDECRDSRACWFGRGYALVLAKRHAGAISRGCAAAPSRPSRLACVRGAGFRLGASNSSNSPAAERAACRGFGGALHACRAGFGLRETPIDFA